MGRKNHAVSRVARAAVLVALAAAATAVSGCTNSGSQDSANLVNGKKLFVSKCGACHTLAHAQTKGIVGPNLDEAFAVARAEGWGDNSIRGVVLGQIGYPGRGTKMPADLVTGENAQDVAAYVAATAAVPGKDGGLLATAVQSQTSTKPAVAQNGVLTIDADPTGQLAYVQKTAEATAGPIELKMVNQSGVPHNVEIEGTGIATAVVPKGTPSAKGTLKPGTYTYFCAVPGHRAGGMVGKLTVK